MKFLFICGKNMRIPVNFSKFSCHADVISTKKEFNRFRKDNSKQSIVLIKKKIMEKLKSKAKEYDVIFLCNGKFLLEQSVQDIKKFVKSLQKTSCVFFWSHDAIDREKRYRFSDIAYYSDIVSSVCIHNLNIYKQRGCNSLQLNQIYQGYNAGVFYPMNFKKKNDVLFIGSNYGKRLELIKFLKKEGIKIYHPKVWDDKKVNKVYNQSKICLNMSSGDWFSNRCIHILGAGSFLLSKYSSDLNKTFKNEKGLVLWNNKEELLSQIIYYLDKGIKRTQISSNGKEMVKNFTWDKQWYKILSVINGKQIIDGAFKY